MKIQTVVKSACAGMVIYVAMAACAASEKSMTARVEDDAAVTGSSGANEDAKPSIIDVIEDAAHDVFNEASDPVGDAKADDLPPDEVTEPCDKSVVVNQFKYLYAEHAYPGASIAELSSSVTAMKSYASTATGTDIGPLPGYKHASIELVFKPGFVAAICEPHSKDDTTAAITSVTFVRRR